jgi:methionyl-tRNA formyltransferase
MNIVFMGSPDFAVPSLERLLAGKHRVLAVVTVPDKPAGRGQLLKASAVKERALAAGLPVLQPENLSDPEFIQALGDLAADLFVVVAFRILPPAVFTLPGKGTINLHASLLPRYRGAAPINWALINGDSETGLTTFFIEEKVDTGNILLQKRVPIAGDMTAGELYAILQQRGAELIEETVDGLAEDRLQTVEQSGPVSAAPKIFKEMGSIDWSRSARDIYNLYRGLTPVPGVYSFVRGKMCKFLDMAPGTEKAQDVPGTVARISDQGYFEVTTGDGTVRVLKVQLEGKKPLPVQEFLRGFALSVGERFLQS